MQLNHRIFKGISPENLVELTDALQTTVADFAKGSILLSQGEENQNICVLLSGKAHAVRYTAEGREVDYALLQEGSLYGYALAFSRSMRSPVTVFADGDCRVLYFSYSQLLSLDRPEAKILLQNLIEELSDSYFSLQRRLHYLTCDSLREKILSYLFDQCGSAQETFSIPLNRSALAAYLYCDRSALCRELSRLKSEGIIWYKGNAFRILKVACFNF